MQKFGLYLKITRDHGALTAPEIGLEYQRDNLVLLKSLPLLLRNLEKYSLDYRHRIAG